MTRVWFDHGLSSVADAIAMVKDGDPAGWHLVASHRERDAPALRAADESFVEPRVATGGAAGEAGAAAAAGLAWALEVCRERRIALFAVQSRQRLLAPHAAAFARVGTHLLLPAPADTLETLDDKARFHVAAQAAGLPLPWAVEVHDGRGFEAARASLRARGLEACVKPPRGIFGAGYWRLDDTLGAFEALMDPDARRVPPALVRAALDEALGQALGQAPGETPGETPGRAGAPAPRLLVLEYLPGPEWSVDCLCEAGRVHAAVARLKGARVQRLAVEGAAVALAARTVAAFDLSSLVNVQLRAAGEDPEGDLRVLEVNARMSGGCLYTRASGINLPWWQLALATGARTPEQMPRAVGGAVIAPRTCAEPVPPTPAEPLTRS